MDDAWSRADLTALAVATVREGCVGETLGALIASERARCARGPTLSGALRRIAADEARHAALAWRIVRWAIERGGEPVRCAVTDAFAASLASLEAREAAPQDHVDAELWHAHGRLTPSEELALAQRGACEIVEPCAAALVRGGNLARNGGSSRSRGGIDVPSCSQFECWSPFQRRRAL